MQRKFAFLGLIVALTLLLGACAPRTAAPTATPQPTTTPAPLVLTDGLGREVRLSEAAQRVVSLAPSNTEILFAIGAGAQVVGRDEFSDYPAEVASLPSVGGSFGGYNNEAIVALHSDLVLAAEINTPEQVDTLASLGLTVYYLANPHDMEGLYQNLATVAQLTGHSQQAETLIASLKARVAAVTEKIAPLSYQPAVYYELDATDPNAPYTAGKGTFVDMLINMAGGWNVGSVLDSPWAQISAEELVAQNPQIIILGDAAYGTTPEAVKARPGWESLDAVQNDRIYPFDDNLVSRPGPRLVDGLETLARLLHPEVFK